jgi:hypothetical protein
MTKTRLSIVAVAALVALALAAYAVAQQTGTVASYTGCLKNGKLESIAVGDAPAVACGAGQAQVRLSGGDVTSVHVRAGLLGGGDSGDIDVGVDPGFWQKRVGGSCLGNPVAPADASISAIHDDGTVTCNNDDTGSSTDVFAGFWDGPEPMPPMGQFLVIPPIAQLALPAGKFAISATLDVSTDDGPADVSCALRAGVDFDRADNDLNASSSRRRLALTVVHEFTGPGTAQVGCGHFDSDLQVWWGFLKITAIRVADLSNGPLTLLP